MHRSLGACISTGNHHERRTGYIWYWCWCWVGLGRLLSGCPAVAAVGTSASTSTTPTRHIHDKHCDDDGDPSRKRTPKRFQPPSGAVIVLEVEKKQAVDGMNEYFRYGETIAILLYIHTIQRIHSPNHAHRPNGNFKKVFVTLLTFPYTARII